MNYLKESPRTGRTVRGRSGAGTAQYQYSAIQNILPRLEGVTQTGPDQYMAKSPCRDDRTPSLSIKAVDDRILIHDFGGNSPDEIMAALGMTLADLFDKPLDHHRKPLSAYQRRRYGQAVEALKALSHECRIVCVLAEQMHAGFNLDPAERQRLKLAMTRVSNAERVAE